MIDMIELSNNFFLLRLMLLTFNIKSERRLDKVYEWKLINLFDGDIYD